MFGLLKLISVVLEVGNVEILKVNASNKSKSCWPCISLTEKKRLGSPFTSLLKGGKLAI